MEIKSMEQAIKIFGFYLQRWGKEEGYRFSKSFLNLENIRTLNWRAIQSLAFIVFLAYLFVCLFYLSAPEQIESLAGERLKAFRSIKTVKFKYYRVAKLIQILLWEQRKLPCDDLAMTEVA